jgi:nitrate reductase NapE component
LNHDYTEEDEKDELKVFLFIFFIFFSVIMVQKKERTVLYAYA